MKLFTRFLLLFALFALAATFVTVNRYGLPYPHTLGPQLDDTVRNDYILAFKESGAQMVLIGDSGLLDSTDPKQFEQAVGQKIYFKAVPGSATAQWYALIKNTILPRKDKPDTLVILFRDTVLTTPDFRVTGKYLPNIDELARSSDSEIVNRAFIWPMSPLERFFSRYFSLYGGRLTLRADIESTLKYNLPTLFNCDAGCVDTALWETFASDRMNNAVMGDSVAEAEDYLLAPKNMNFKARVNQSFLPLFIDMARKNHIHLILARARTRDSLDPGGLPPQMDAYFRDLQAYLKAQGVTYLSFADETRLTESDFNDSVHMNDGGKQIFTQIFAEAVRQQVQGKAGAQP